MQMYSMSGNVICLVRGRGGYPDLIKLFGKDFHPIKLNAQNVESGDQFVRDSMVNVS